MHGKKMLKSRATNYVTQRPEKYRHTSTAGREPAGGIGIYEQNLFNTVEALCDTVKFNSYLISKKAFWLPTNCRF